MAYSGFAKKGGKQRSGDPAKASSASLAQRVGERELSYPLCVTCSTQTDYDGSDLSLTSDDSDRKCPICLDPRQFIGPDGQKWTTLQRLIDEKKYTNVFEELIEGQVWAFKTEPSFGIGQRAFLIKDAEEGLVMWDCVAYLDDATLEMIDKLSDGRGLACQVVSHPHYYSTTAVWAKAFPQMKMCIAKCDFEKWYQRRDVQQEALEDAGQFCLFEEVHTPLYKVLGSKSFSNFTILRLGGHFPGSAVLLWKHVLFIADTIQVVPSGIYKSHEPQRPGVASVTFLWSYPNQIPLSAAEVERVCAPLEQYSFNQAYGAFEGFNIYGHAKDKIMQSRDIYVKRCEAK